MAPIKIIASGVLTLISFAFILSSTSLTIWSTKVTGEFPERKRRDWAVIWGLLGSGLVAGYIAVWLNPVTRALKRAGQLPNTTRLLYLALACITGLLALDEAVLVRLRDARKRSARAKGTLMGINPTPGYSDRNDLTLDFTDASGRKWQIVSRSVPWPSTGVVKVGDVWPDDVRYDPSGPTRDGDATVRDWPIYVDDIAFLTAECVVMCLLVYGLPHMR